MTYASGTFYDVAPFEDSDLPRGSFRRIVLGLVVIGFGTAAAAWVIAASVTMVAAWMIAASLATSPNLVEKAPSNLHEALHNLHEKAPIDVAPASQNSLIFVDPYGAPSGMAHFSGSVSVVAALGRAANLTRRVAPSPPVALPPVALSPVALPPVVAAPDIAPPPRPDFGPLKSVFPAAPERSVPLPPSDPFLRPHIEVRDAILAPPARPISRPIVPLREPTANPAPRDDRNPFQKLFAALKQPSGPALADLRPEDRDVSRAPAYSPSVALPAADSRTAVYDIAAHTVYLPDGERLEAHSGLGDRLDDPRHVNEKNRGATPPHIYDLTLRRQLFHGVAALRLNPVGAGNMFGRTGLLAHTYMLGPYGASNGCVSFRNYARFLQAFSRGEVTRLVVVTHLGAAPRSPGRGYGRRYASMTP